MSIHHIIFYYFLTSINMLFIYFTIHTICNVDVNYIWRCIIMDNPLWKNIGFYNQACNWVFQLQRTFATHGINTALNASGQVATIAANTLCYIQYHICGVTHMQLYATSLQQTSTLDSHAHSNVANEMPTWLFIHLSTNDVC
jgi:hypothetical protein